LPIEPRSLFAPLLPTMHCDVMPRPKDIVVCGAGLKGAVFVEGLLEKGFSINAIFAYPQSGDMARGFELLKDIAKQKSIDLIETRRPSLEAEKLTFVVGWQYLLTSVTPSTVVFHDSLLPRYRGFAPTVTALIKGEREIGVTALRPSMAVDEGPIIAQRAQPISYPIKIEAALKLQASLMTDLAADIVATWQRFDQLTATPQRDDLATYSIWREDADFNVDWSKSGEEIERFVNAVGYPYAGARTTVDGGERVRIFDVTTAPDLPFEIRDVGKIWRLDNGRPIVICGTGMLRIDRCCREDGSPFILQRVRSRLQSPR
jgi:methionyl-tRNA formyltransferase